MADDDGGNTYSFDPKEHEKERTARTKPMRAPAAWAREGNDEPIPVNKIPGIPAHKLTSGTLDATRLPGPFVNNTQDLSNQVQAAVMVLREHDKRIKQLEQRK